jgi:hypothetical protein
VAGSVKISNPLLATSTKIVIKTESSVKYSFSGNFTYSTDEFSDLTITGGTVTKFQDSFGLTLDKIS